MDKKKAICEYLRKNHIGKENAIHSKELEKLFLLDGRNTVSYTHLTLPTKLEV